MSVEKKYLHNIDLANNKLLNPILNPLTTVQRTAVGTLLTVLDEGYVCFDTTLNQQYFWNGTTWITVTGVTSWGSITGSITSQTDLIAYLAANYYPLATNPANYIDLTDLSAGTGISYNNLTGVITNSAPDQVVALTGGTGISTSGTYPSFTITNTSPDQTVSIGTTGTGLSVTGTYPSFTLQNTLPDQTVALTAGTGIGVTGTYPNFTITNNSPSSGGTVTGSGTLNYISKWTPTGTALGDSQIFDNGSGVMVNTTTYNDYKFDINGSARVQTNLVVGPINSILVDTAYALRVNTPLSGSVNAFGVFSDGESQSDVTNNTYYFRSFAKTAAASFTLANVNHFAATQGTFGLGSTVTNQYGFRVFFSLTGATNNYGFYGDIGASANNWNLYMNGTAKNYLAGNTLIGGTTDSGFKLDVTGTFRTSGQNTLSNLAGSGTRMVVASSTGVLSTQTIPTGTVTGVTATSPITSSGGTAPVISTSMATNRLIGRTTAGTGVMEEIFIGTGLSLSGGTLSNSAPFATPLTTKGDIYVRNATVDTRLPVGLDTQVLLADSSTTTGLRWGTNTAATPTGYYGSFFDITTQVATLPNTPYPMFFGQTDLSNGVTIVSNGTNLTRITIANTGIYNIQFSAQLSNSDNAPHDATIWLRKNGIDIPDSSGYVGLEARKTPIDPYHLVTAWNYVISAVGGDYFEIMWAVDSTTISIITYPATVVAPEVPSTILTVTQQSGIMAGTGITAINSLTGAVQTLVTGTTGTDFGIVSSGTSHTFNLPTASASNTGKLSSSDWTTFNNKVGANDTDYEYLMMASFRTTYNY